MKILLIEDVRVERKIFKQWIEELGCEVIEAADGVEGLIQYRSQHPDLVITDIVMPNKEGIELMITLKKEFPNCKILAISGAGQTPGQYLPLAKSLGALKTFVKPIDKKELLDAIKEFSTDAVT